MRSLVMGGGEHSDEKKKNWAKRDQASRRKSSKRNRGATGGKRFWGVQTINNAESCKR